MRAAWGWLRWERVSLYRRLAALALGMLLAMAVPALASAQSPTDVAGRTDELRDLTTRLRQSVVAIGSTAPSAVLIADFTRRRELLQELAELDARAALDVALTPSDVAALPVSLAPLAEKWVYRVGHVGIVHADVPGASASGGHSIYLVENGRQTQLRLAPAASDRRPSEKVLIAGFELPSDGTIVAGDVTVLASIAAKSPVGVQRTALLLASASGAPAHPYGDKTNTASLYFSRTSGQSLYAFINEASYGLTQVAGASGGAGTAADVFGPYTVPLTCSTTTLIPNLLGQANPEANFNNYDRIVVLLNHPSSCSYAGVASVGTYPLGSYDGATQFLSYSINVNTANGSTALNGKVGGTVLHEYGHNLGLYHAWTVSCGNFALSTTGCTQLEYGDPSDVMGRSFGYGHYSAAYKEQLEWLAAPSIQTVSSSTTYALSNIEGSSGVRALKIPRRDAQGNVTSHYYLEYRVPTTSWRTYATIWPNYDRAVLTHVLAPEGSGPATHTQLVDTQPASITGETTSSFNASDPDDAPIRAGETNAHRRHDVSVAGLLGRRLVVGHAPAEHDRLVRSLLDSRRHHRYSDRRAALPELRRLRHRDHRADREWDVPSHHPYHDRLRRLRVPILPRQLRQHRRAIGCDRSLRRRRPNRDYHAYADTHDHAYSDHHLDAHRLGHADDYAYPHRHADPQRHHDAHHHTQPDGVADAHGHRDPHAFAHRHGNSGRPAHGHAHANQNAHNHADPDDHTHTHGHAGAAARRVDDAGVDRDASRRSDDDARRDPDREARRRCPRVSRVQPLQRRHNRPREPAGATRGRPELYDSPECDDGWNGPNVRDHKPAR
jgi:hypothetical protein